MRPYHDFDKICVAPSVVDEEIDWILRRLIAVISVRCCKVSVCRWSVEIFCVMVLGHLECCTTEGEETRDLEKRLCRCAIEVVPLRLRDACKLRRRLMHFKSICRSSVPVIKLSNRSGAVPVCISGLELQYQSNHNYAIVLMKSGSKPWTYGLGLIPDPKNAVSLFRRAAPQSPFVSQHSAAQPCEACTHSRVTQSLASSREVQNVGVSSAGRLLDACCCTEYDRRDAALLTHEHAKPGGPTGSKYGVRSMQR